jgi:tetratricopeptide (TPR) repeat protein
MRVLACFVLTVGLLGALVGAAAGQDKDPWVGNGVMPVSDNVRLREGRADKGGVRDIGWPARVERREGQWLWISDTTGYSSPPLSGWINTSQVVQLDQGIDYYSKQIGISPQASFYWLRGICWETQGEKEIAKLDFEQAIKRFDAQGASSQSSADAHMRLGRIEAAEATHGVADNDQPAVGVGPNTAAASAQGWLARFERALQGAPDRPRFQYEWAEAHRKAYEQSGDDAHFARAESLYSAARQLDDVWPPVYQGPAALYMAKGRRNSGESQPATGVAPAPAANAAVKGTTPERVAAASAPPAKPAAEPIPAPQKEAKAQDASSLPLAGQQAYRRAIALANEAIRVNPRVAAAYGGRAEAYYALGQYAPAHQSALKACELSLYREPSSLKLLAQTYSQLGVYNLAAYYAQKAAENAGSHREQAEMLQLCKSYIDEYYRQPNAGVGDLLQTQIVANAPVGGKAGTGGRGRDRGIDFDKPDDTNPPAPAPAAGSRPVMFLPTFTPNGVGR